MHRIALPILFLIISLSSGFGQVKFPYPINTDSREENASILPDSSIILMSQRSGTDKCYRFVYRGNEWVSSPNSLTAKINGLILTDKIRVYRINFSKDFTRVLITMHKKQKYWIYESKLIGDEWSYFNLILDERNKSNEIVGFGYGANNNIILTTGDIELAPNFLEFKRTESGWVESRVIDLKKFKISSADYAYYIGKGLLFLANWKAGNGNVWVYSKNLGSNTWSVPTNLGSLSGWDHSFTLSGYNYLYQDWGGDIYISDTPQFLKNEIAKSRSTTKPEVGQAKGLISSTPSKSKIIKPTGQYYALLIGNSDYKLDDLDLDNPANDAKELAKVLEASYQFEEKNIIQLINSDRNSILKELYSLRKTLTPEDNLLIFYAGHGYWDDGIGQGYWWPVDATRDNPSNWLSNSDLREQIRGINSAHTLLISDACFSGGIFKTRGAGEIRSANRDIQLLYRMPSRRAITSGILETVPDKSVFFKYFLKYLSENDKKFVSSSELFTAIRTSVLNNSLTVPQEGVILNTGDEGGDFIFIKKE